MPFEIERKAQWVKWLATGDINEILREHLTDSEKLLWQDITAGHFT